MRKTLYAGLLAVSLPGLASACATCGCTLSADAAMGYSALSGWQLNLEYDYINQDQLRSGASTATPAQVVNNPSDPTLGGGEIEKQTINRYLTGSLIYRPNANWNFDLLVPYVDRTHSTYGQQQSPYDAADVAPSGISNADVSGLGDIKFITSYQGLLPTHNLGLQLGLKLPTGAYGGPNVYGGNVGHPVFFGTAGNSAGQQLDTSLQAGTGSTDLIVGGYYYQPVSQNFDVFVNAQFQAALVYAMYEPGENYRPGNTATLSTGLRYEADPAFVPQLQLNLSDKSADQGALADTTDTAGKVAYLSPGITARLRNDLHVYGFVQLPIYSDLSGYQVFPRWTASAGLSYAF